LPNLVVMTAGTQCRDAPLSKAAPLARFLDGLPEDFGLVVIDGPSIMAGARSLFGPSNGVVVVVDSSRTRREVVQANLAGLNSEKAKVLGVVLNRQPRYIPRFFYRNL
jgi:Mrp family chromosome partitioning ATPase